jgi:hypothetical protein
MGAYRYFDIANFNWLINFNIYFFVTLLEKSNIFKHWHDFFNGFQDMKNKRNNFYHQLSDYNFLST